MAWPRSIRWRYSLRALFVFITLLALWCGYHADRAGRERTAIAVLEKYRASFTYHHGRPWNASAWEVASTAYPRMVSRLWGERYITDVRIVAPLDEDVVDAMAELPHLASIRVEAARLTKAERERLAQQGIAVPKVSIPDGALEAILKPHSLGGLYLKGFVLSDADCRTIERQRSLRYVSVSHCDLSEVGLGRLLSLPSLRYLEFKECPVTGAKLDTIAGSSTLEKLVCDGAPVQNGLARFVARSPNIAVLRLNSPTIDDVFMEQLGVHQSLAVLTLHGAHITDDCVPFLERMPQLRLQVGKNTFTSQGRDRLQRAGVWID